MQLEWDQKKFIKFEMKKGGSKSKTSNNFSRVLQIALKVEMGVGNFAWTISDHSILFSC